MDDVGFYLISLRPVGMHAGLRRMTAPQGGRVLAMSPLRIVNHSDAKTHQQLREALNCAWVIFTSPIAVRAASELQTIKAKQGQRFFAVGEGTRRALQRAGVSDPTSPTRMDSEGLLALPEIAALNPGDDVGLVTAPGGRGEILARLRARGVQIVRADVYQRQPTTIPNERWDRLQQIMSDATSPQLLALSSAEAFTELLAQLPPALAAPLRSVTIVAASERLAALARQQGFLHIKIAASARPQDLIAAITPDQA